MAYSDELEKSNKEINIVVSIGGEFFARKQPDSGLVIIDENLIVDDPQINGVAADIRRASTPLGSFTFKLKDEDAYITKKIMSAENNFLLNEVICYAGFKTGSFDFSEYKEVARTQIETITKIPNGYSIRSKEITNLITAPTYNVNDKLNIDILAASTTLDLQDASLFPDSGFIKISSEFIRYTGKTNDTLTGLIRGQIGSAADHTEGDDVFLVTEIIDQNPVDILLQLLLSKNGDLVNDPTYDVYKNGLGIDPAVIDIAAFENIRDSFFTDNYLRLYLYGEGDTLKFIEKEVLQPTNIRFFSDNGIIGISVLDQIEIGADVEEIDETVILGTPTWTIGSNKIQNIVKLSFDYDDSTGKYNTLTEFRDEDSIALFGEKKPLQFKYKGVHTDINGVAIINERGEQLLDRLSTPRGSINMRTQFDAEKLSVGQDIRLNHRYLPQQGSGLGLNEQLEVVSKQVDLKNGTCIYKLEYTSYTGIRIAFIAPSPLILSVIDQSTFEVPDGECFRVGHVLRLKDNLTNQYLPDDLNIIESINGNFITMLTPWTTALTTDIRIKLADYPNLISDQYNRYLSIGDNSGFFADGTKSYQILK